VSAHDAPARPFARAHCASCRWRARDGGPGPRKVRRAGLAPSAVPLRKQGRCEKSVCGPPVPRRRDSICAPPNAAQRTPPPGPLAPVRRPWEFFPEEGAVRGPAARAGRAHGRGPSTLSPTDRPLSTKKFVPAPLTGVGRGLHHSELVVRQHVHQRRLPGIVQPHEDDLGVLLEEPCDKSGRGMGRGDLFSPPGVCVLASEAAPDRRPRVCCAAGMRIPDPSAGRAGGDDGRDARRSNRQNGPPRCSRVRLVTHRASPSRRRASRRRTSSTRCKGDGPLPGKRGVDVRRRWRARSAGKRGFEYCASSPGPRLPFSPLDQGPSSAPAPASRPCPRLLLTRRRRCSRRA
jgi:hypothetical protein